MAPVCARERERDVMVSRECVSEVFIVKLRKGERRESERERESERGIFFGPNKRANKQDVEISGGGKKFRKPSRHQQPFKKLFRFELRKQIVPS